MDSKSILEQLEFYFSDSNLSKDNWLVTKIRKQKERYVNIGELLRFNKLKKLGATKKSVLLAVGKSDVLELNEQQTHLRRVNKFTKAKNYDSFTLCAQNIDQSETIDSLTKTFSQFGKVQYTQIPKNRISGLNFGYGFVEYSNEQEMLSAIQSFQKDNFSLIKCVPKLEWLKIRNPNNKNKKKKNNKRKKTRSFSTQLLGVRKKSDQNEKKKIKVCNFSAETDQDLITEFMNWNSNSSVKSVTFNSSTAIVEFQPDTDLEKVISGAKNDYELIGDKDTTFEILKDLSAVSKDKILKQLEKKKLKSKLKKKKKEMQKEKEKELIKKKKKKKNKKNKKNIKNVLQLNLLNNQKTTKNFLKQKRMLKYFQKINDLSKRHQQNLNRKRSFKKKNQNTKHNQIQKKKRSNSFSVKMIKDKK
ncbi:la-related protein [Anaeramoeba flamelloides]|uniref:La-related protein n=1 Tax=Anaeramoeba flamelloides TaxID=1746091 RepID=A0AAV7ZV90_9EUKA|nr:la-related protein [Anaeramoeba flamelloides]